MSDQVNPSRETSENPSLRVKRQRTRTSNSENAWYNHGHSMHETKTSNDTESFAILEALYLKLVFSRRARNPGGLNTIEGRLCLELESICHHSLQKREISNSVPSDSLWWVRDRVVGFD